MLTLYVTPTFYVSLDQAAKYFRRKKAAAVQVVSP
jgi:hypothetical protein